jgi:hypothetical protein
MSRFLVLANQTAASPELTTAVRDIIKRDADTEFVLLVPATPVEDLLDWQDGDSETVARRTAQTAKERLEGVGARVIRIEVGDPSPVKQSKRSCNIIMRSITALLFRLCRCKGPVGWPWTSLGA